MKVTLNVDCTPEEARAFLGLPDLGPMQQAILADLEQRMRANIQAMTPEGMIQMWLPAGMKGVEEAQKLFWSQIQQTMNGLAANASNAMLSFANKGENK